MSLTVVAPLGSSPLADAVVEALKKVKGLAKIQIGPPVYSQTSPQMSGKRFGPEMRLVVPLTRGYRVFLISPEQMESAASMQQLIDNMLAQVGLTALPAEEVSNGERGSWRFKEPPGSAIPRRRAGQGLRREPDIVIRSDPSPMKAATSTAIVDVSVNDVLVIVRQWADDRGLVEGLLTKLVQHFGGTEDSMSQIADQLVAQGLLHRMPGNQALTAPYQRFSVNAKNPWTSPA